MYVKISLTLQLFKLGWIRTDRESDRARVKRRFRQLSNALSLNHHFIEISSFLNSIIWPKYSGKINIICLSLSCSHSLSSVTRFAPISCKHQLPRLPSLMNHHDHGAINRALEVGRGIR